MQDVFVPVYTTTLIGRTRETAEVVALINDPAIQLVTLTGTSGTGKTRLSIEVITSLKQQDQKIIFVPLAAITKPEYVLPTLAQQLDIRENGLVELIDLVIEHLRQQPAIIVLDNFEQVVTAAYHLEQLIQSNPALTILVTSQIPLELVAETIYDIPGLDVPDTIPESPEEALHYAAVQLFVQRIQAVQPGFYLDKKNVEPVVEICQMLEGLPLAIEIVAAHSGVLLPHDLRLLVKQHLMLYRFRAKGATGRQRIILPMIEWSLLRLPESAQELFKHVGVFQGGWMFDALQAVVEEFDDLEGILNLLVKRHLILQQEITTEQIRYMMLDAVQDFANTYFGQLPSAERTSYIQRHMKFMQNLARESRTKLISGVDQRLWIDRLNQEMPNIRFLLDWSLRSDPQQAVELSKELGYFWNINGYWKEGADWYQQITVATKANPADTAMMLMYYVSILSALSSYDKAQELGHIGIAAAQESGEQFAEGRILNTLGLISLDQQDYPQAKIYLEKSAQIAKKIDHVSLLSATLSNLATIDSILHDYEAALARYQESLEIARSIGKKMAEMVALCNIGYLHVVLGETEKALELFPEVIEWAQEAQIKDFYAVCIGYKAQALLLGNLPGAIPLLQESITILDELGSVMYLCLVLDTAAGIFEQHGSIKKAGLVIGAVDQIRNQIQIPRNLELDNPNPVLDHLLERVKDSTEFQQARTEGQTWNRQQVIKFALQELTSIDT